ncbi:aromatic acid exporter family protein [Leucobacter sp. NPDC058333]|uniref:FUSC family protein n=1 Tax=Leucobacter sp. NPDC058333 TaxID=3346450 RepID=UPI0036557D89
MAGEQFSTGGVPTAPRRALNRTLNLALNVARPMLTRYRLLLALKAAIGVTAAWLIGRLLPGELETYAYYAPLGALLGVAPTIVSSVRTSIELIAGIVIGVAIGWALVGTGTPWYVRAPVAAGVGMLIAGVRTLGEGRTYVPIAAVFVVILGAGDPESYVAGYVAQFGIGLLVGTLVNVVFIPPLTYGYARSRVADLKSDFASAADDLAAVLLGEWPPDRADWLDDARRRQRSVDEVEAMVVEAKESGRGNPRAMWRSYDASGDDADIEALRYVGLRLADISDALGGAIWHQPVAVTIPSESIDALGRALGDLAEYIRAWNTGVDLEDAHDRYADAVREVGDVFERAATESGFGTIVFALRSMLGRIEARTTPED